MTDVLDAARRAEPFAREAADAAETSRRLPSDLVETLVAEGLMRMGVPQAYGGPGASPMDIVQAIAEVARGDGAAGWCVMIAATTSSLAGFLEPSAAETIYRNPLSVSGGAYAPSGTAVSVPGGWRVTGRWQWGSGGQHCQWMLGGCITDTKEFRLMFAPSAEISIHDTWFVSGLRGTGSNDFEMVDVFVPEHHSVLPLAARAMVDEPLARFPNFNLLAAGVAATTLGIARRAIDEVVALAASKRPSMSTKTIAQSSLVQFDIARAEAHLGSARAWLLEALNDGWQTALGGDRVSIDQRVRVRMAAAHAATQAAAATDLAYNAAGGSSVFNTSPLQRCHRDVHTATQHLMVSPRILESAGRVLLGQSIDTSQF